MSSHSPEEEARGVTPLVDPREQGVEEALGVSPGEEEVTLGSDEFVGDNYCL